MKIVKYMFFVLIIIAQLTSNAQYNWEQVTLPDSIGVVDIAFNTYNEIFIVTNHGPYYSQNGNQWEWLGINDYPGTIYISDNNSIYIGSSDLYRSTDNGITWDTLSEDPNGGGINSIYSQDDITIYYGTWGGIFRSTNGGENWMKVLDLYNTEVVNAIAENSVGKLFAGSTSFSGDISPGGTYCSTDGGATWQLTGLNYCFVSSIVINTNDEIFVGIRGHWTNGGGGVFKSVDNGNTWETAYLNILVNALTLNNDDEIAFSCPIESYPYGGVHFSNDAGNIWSDITGNLTGDYFDKVAFDYNSILYAVGLYGDMFRTETPVNVSQRQFAQQDSFISYPNPAKDQINLVTNEYNIESVYITDISGRLIKKMRPPISQCRIEVNIIDLTPSVYLIHLKSDHNIHTFKFIKY